MTFPNDRYPETSRVAPWPEQYTYLVSWEANFRQIVKVGVTYRPLRWRSFVSRGAGVNVIVRSSERFSRELENDTHELLDILARRAFKTKEESLPYLSGGSGWTECYETDALTAMRAMKVVLDALVQG
jgi:hypothetical protein